MMEDDVVDYKKEFAIVRELSDIVKKEDIILLDTNMLFSGAIDNEEGFIKAYESNKIFHYSTKSLKEAKDYFKKYYGAIFYLNGLCKVILTDAIKNEAEPLHYKFIRLERGVRKYVRKLKEIKDRIRNFGEISEIKDKINININLEMFLKNIKKSISSIKESFLDDIADKDHYNNFYELVNSVVKSINGYDISEADKSIVAYALWYSSKDNISSFVVSRDKHIRFIFEALKNYENENPILDAGKTVFLYPDKGNVTKIQI